MSARRDDEILGALQTIAELLDAQSRRVQPDIQTEPFSINNNGINILVPGTQGQRIFVCVFLAVAGAGVTITPGTAEGDTGGHFRPFSGQASTGNPGDVALAANGVFGAAVQWPQFIFRTEPGRAFAMNLSGGVQVGGLTSYWKA